MTSHDGSGRVVLAAVLRVDEHGTVSAVDTANAINPVGSGGVLPPPAPISPTAAPSSRSGSMEPGAEIMLAVIGAAFSEELQAILAAAGVDGVAALQRALEQGRIALIEIAPSAFLGLTRKRPVIRSLRIDDSLFFFVPPGVRHERLAKLLADLVSQAAPG